MTPPKYNLVCLLALAACLTHSFESVVAQRSSPQFAFPSAGSQDHLIGSSNGESGDQQPKPASSKPVASGPPTLPVGQPLVSLSPSGPSQTQQQKAAQQQQQASQSRPQQQLLTPVKPQKAQQQQAAPRNQNLSPSAPISTSNIHQHHHHQGHHSNAASQHSAIEVARRAEATAASLAAGSGNGYQCPEPFGYFRHHKSCDKYYACDNGTATLKLCGNGLMFDDSDSRRENCAYPFSVDCGDRSESEPAISTTHCPRLYGLFAEPTNCRIFYSCWNGESSKYECPPGLAYDNEQRVCVWADTVDRCDQSEVSDGFVCPDPTEVEQPGHYTRHAHPTDCRKFYVCIEGVARPYGCSIGMVFNVDSNQCDEPENVTGCEKYYGDTLEPKPAKKLQQIAAGQSRPQASLPSRSSSSSSASSSTSSSSAVGSASRP